MSQTLELVTRKDQHGSGYTRRMNFSVRKQDGVQTTVPPANSVAACRWAHPV